jgi:hypothetical protein
VAGGDVSSVSTFAEANPIQSAQWKLTYGNVVQHPGAGPALFLLLVKKEFLFL